MERGIIGDKWVSKGPDRHTLPSIHSLDWFLSRLAPLREFVLLTPVGNGGGSRYLGDDIAAHGHDVRLDVVYLVDFLFP